MDLMKIGNFLLNILNYLNLIKIIDINELAKKLLNLYIIVDYIQKSSSQS
jgi:hypothetical protein